MMESGLIAGKAVDKFLEADKIDAENAAKKEAEIRAAGKKKEDKKETPGGIKAGKTLAEMMESVEVKAKEKTEKKKEKVEKDSNRKRLQEEKKALQERIKALQAANERELALIDARIEAEKMKAEEWERNAAGMREAAKGGGRGFSNFIRSRRDAEKDEQKENRMREMALRRARAQMENIEERARRRPLGRLTADEKRRWQEAKQFIDAQDARNNPALKAAEELEKKRAAAVDNVRKAIEKIEKVIETKVAL
jgi:translation initiation factor IF-2